MIVLADNDVILKLAQCDLFAEFLTAFAVSPDQVLVVKAARFSMSRASTRRRIGDESMAKLEQILAVVHDIPLSPNPAFFAALNEQFASGIDAGEAILFATCPEINDSFVVTGDKRCLIGLNVAAATDPICDEVRRALAGRVCCFEQVVLRILNNSGFDNVLDKLLVGRECDKGLALWLGYGSEATEANFRAGLDSFLAEARRTSGLLLAPDGIDR